MELMVELPTGGYELARYVQIHTIGEKSRVSHYRPESRAGDNKSDSSSQLINIVENNTDR